ncbi:MAG: hypothetical protein JSV88_18605 [Candidatus Aminicenantes bacterium]|nr:MAG: hypothetical protein JSV88_18605 [Candidatus Aminicenantes bacterium]
MKEVEKIEDLSREELLELARVYAKNWLAHDGCWFLAAEQKYGMDTAIELDTESWRNFTVIEARRLIDFLQLGENSGIEGMKKALRFRLYATINEDEISVGEDGKTLEYRVKTCRVQAARRRRGLGDFPCKSVGIVEFSLFAKTIDGRFDTACISCSPEITNPDYCCIWRFTLKE